MMPGAGRGVFTWMSRMYRFVGPGLIDVQHQPAVVSDKVEYNPVFGYERLLHAAPSGLETFSQRWTEPVTCPAAARRWSRRDSMEREMVPRPVIVMTWLLILAASMAGLAWMQWPSGNSDGSIEERYDSSIYENLDPSFSKEHMRGRLISAARKNPGFGGVFMSNRQTVLNIYIAEDENDPERWEKDRQALEELLDPQSGLRLNVIKGDYSITQLSEWYDLMQSEGIWDQDGVHMIDLDEGINRLYIGVVTEWEVEGVYTFLEGIGIPRGAATVEAVEPAKPAGG